MSCGTRLVAIPGSELDFAMLLIPKDAAPRLRFPMDRRGKNPKAIQTLMGHSSIKVTYDVYGHLFADADADQKAAEDIEFRLRGA